MDRTERVAVIHRLLSSHRKGVTQQRLMQETGNARSSLYRDLTFMRDTLGAPIVREGDPIRLWRYSSDAAGTFQLPGMWMNADEVHALLQAQQVLQRGGDGVFGQALGPLQPRIHALLGDRAFRLNRMRVMRTQARQDDTAVFRLVSEALLSGRQLKFSYHARSTGRTSERVVSPQQMLHHRDNWYLDAVDATSAFLGRFALDRIANPQVLAEASVDLPAAELDAQTESGYGIFAGPEIGTAVLRFTPHAARWVADEQWHAKQRQRHLPDGSLELTLPYSSSRELLMDVLRYAKDAQVLAPKELRAEMRTLLLETTAGYPEEAEEAEEA